MGKHADTIPETSQEKALANIGSQEWERGKSFRPLRTFLINNVMRGGDEQRRSQNVVTSDVRQSFGKNRAASEASAARGGARPGSGAFSGDVSGSAVDEAATLAAARGGTKVAVDNQRFSNLQNIVRMGEGQQAEGVAGLTAVTRNAQTEAARAAALSAQEHADRAALVGTLVGAAGAYKGKPTGPKASDYHLPGDTSGADLEDAGPFNGLQNDFHIADQPLTGFGG